MNSYDQTSIWTPIGILLLVVCIYFAIRQIQIAEEPIKNPEQISYQLWKEKFDNKPFTRIVVCSTCLQGFDTDSARVVCVFCGGTRFKFVTAKSLWNWSSRYTRFYMDLNGTIVVTEYHYQTQTPFVIQPFPWYKR